MNIVDDIVAGPVKWVFDLIASDVTYQAQGSLAPAVLRATMRRLNPQELLAAAIQQGTLITIKADQFVTVVGNPSPRRYDRIICNGISYTVERWDPSIVSGVPVFFKISALGGQQ